LEFSIPLHRGRRHNGRVCVIKRTHENYRWQLADDFAPCLDSLLRSEPAQVLKDDRAKFVARHDVNGRAFYVKRYRHGAFPFRPWKFYFKPSQARQEWSLAAEFEKRGLHVVRHVALGERWSARGLMESVLVTEGFPGVPLESRHAAFFPAVADFVRAMAKARVAHNDFHPANLLLQESSGEVRLIDLYGARISEREAADVLEKDLLAQLCISLPLPVSAEMRKAGAALRRSKLSERARRCLKDNRDFTARKLGRFKWQLRRAALRPQVEAVLRDPDGFLAGAKELKAGRSSTVGAANGLVLKRNNFKKLFNPVKDLFRGSRGRRDYLKAYHLELCGIPTARVIATGDQRVLGLPIRSFVLMEEISQAIDAGQADDSSLRKLAPLLARLHEEGFTHRDLKETNLLFDAGGAPHLIDLDGLRFLGDVSPSEAAANLRRLAEGLAAAGKLTRRNTIAFLLQYCRQRKLFPRQLFPRA
jgi:tRNA A-37 threonylcarbamoyl transferase component Bud32